MSSHGFHLSQWCLTVVVRWETEFQNGRTADAWLLRQAGRNLFLPSNTIYPENLERDSNPAIFQHDLFSAPGFVDSSPRLAHLDGRNQGLHEGRQVPAPAPGRLQLRVDLGCQVSAAAG